MNGPSDLTSSSETPDHLPAPIGEVIPAELVERLRQGAHEARGTMSAETGRALRKAFGAFHRWCGARDAPALPATVELVVEYVDALAVIPNRKPAGIRRAVWAIGRMHRLAQCPDPTEAEPVRQAGKRMARVLDTRQR